MTGDMVRRMLERWRSDPEGTYRRWFVWEERLKNFRSIRRGVEAVIGEIELGRFGNQDKGSSLETVVKAIAEQRQIFKGADHAFQWKPKLRIPDIYENAENQRAFAAFLKTCSCCREGDVIVSAIRQLDRQAIRGLGPAAANILYFLHPTLVPPSNTAILNGYNLLTHAKAKLGKWTDYLAMREGVLALNAAHRDLLSNDLGAAAGFLFDVGSERYPVPLDTESPTDVSRWEADLSRVREASAAELKALAQTESDEHSHVEVQGWLRDLGRALGFDVWIASNDRTRAYEAGQLADGCLAVLPARLAGSPSADAIGLIDVLWLERGTGTVAAAFEVEHTTSIYSGIVRMLDLALGVPEARTQVFFLVAPDRREDDVRAQLGRPAFSRVTDLDVRFLPYSQLRENRVAMARFGQGRKAVEAVAKHLRERG